jgi:hypothetical protein
VGDAGDPNGGHAGDWPSLAVRGAAALDAQEDAIASLRCAENGVAGWGGPEAELKVLLRERQLARSCHRHRSTKRAQRTWQIPHDGRILDTHEIRHTEGSLGGRLPKFDVHTLFHRLASPHTAVCKKQQTRMADNSPAAAAPLPPAPDALETAAVSPLVRIVEQPQMDCALPPFDLKNTPSRTEGIDEELETALRRCGCLLIQRGGILLRQPQARASNKFCLGGRAWLFRSVHGRNGQASQTVVSNHAPALPPKRPQMEQKRPHCKHADPCHISIAPHACRAHVGQVVMASAQILLQRFYHRRSLLRWPVEVKRLTVSLFAGGSAMMPCSVAGLA